MNTKLDETRTIECTNEKENAGSRCKESISEARQVSSMWENIHDQMPTDICPRLNRRTWQEVRIFVSSTFSDFFFEREVLVKRVFPQLRQWGESYKINIVEVDLRWGVPAGATSEIILRSCLGEIDRCREMNIIPFFLNMLGQRYGWVPNFENVPVAIAEQYSWVHGASVTHMEILCGAFRETNPNALFMLRDSSYLKKLPRHFISQFMEMNPINALALDVLKDKIKERFEAKGQVVAYSTEVAGVSNSTTGMDKVIFEGLSEGFACKILDFFKMAISRQYPLADGIIADEVDLRWEDALSAQHLEFESKHFHSHVPNPLQMEKLVDRLFSPPGTKPQDPAKIDKIDFHTVLQRLPLVIYGGSGVGKSSLLIEFANHVRRRGHCVLFHTTEVLNWNEGHDAYQNTVFSIDSQTAIAQLYLRICLAMGSALIRSECIAIMNSLDSYEKNEQSESLYDVAEQSRSEQLETMLTITTWPGHVFDQIRTLFLRMINLQQFSPSVTSDCPAVIAIDSIYLISSFQGKFILPLPLPPQLRCVVTASTGEAVECLTSLAEFDFYEGCSIEEREHLPTYLFDMISCSCANVTHNNSTATGVASKIVTIKDEMYINESLESCNPDLFVSTKENEIWSAYEELVRMQYLSFYLFPPKVDLISDIATAYLGKFNKILSADQLESLLNNPGSSSLSWLLLACEEIRVFGAFETVSDYISELPSNVEGLLIKLLLRIVDIAKVYFVPTVSLKNFLRNGQAITGQPSRRMNSILRDVLLYLVISAKGFEEFVLQELVMQFPGTIVDRNTTDPTSTDLVVPSTSIVETASALVNQSISTAFVNQLNAKENASFDSKPDVTHPTDLKIQAVSAGYDHDLGAQEVIVTPECAEDKPEQLTALSREDWIVAKYYLRPFLACSTSIRIGTNKHRKTVVRFLDETRDQNTFACIEDELRAGRLRFATYLLQNKHRNLDYFYESYPSQILMAEDKSRIIEFLSSGEMGKISYSCRQQMTLKYRCPGVITTSGQFQTIMEKMCLNCSMRKAGSSSILNSQSCGLCKTLTFSRKMGTNWVLNPREGFAYRCSRHNIKSNGHVAPNAPPRRQDCFYCKLPLMTEGIPIILCYICSFGSTRCMQICG